MGTVMIVANQTLGAETLRATVRDRIDGGARDFYVVVPATHTTHEAAGWMGGFEGMSHQSMVEALERDAGRLSETHLRAEHRLSKMIDQIEAAGGTAEGEVGDEDPLTAAKDALHGRKVDEVIVSTLPHARSRWLRMDLPSRLARATTAVVTTVEATHS
jgi:hypothetical protein